MASLSEAPSWSSTTTRRARTSYTSLNGTPFRAIFLKEEYRLFTRP